MSDATEVEDTTRALLRRRSGGRRARPKVLAPSVAALAVLIAALPAAAAQKTLRLLPSAPAGALSYSGELEHVVEFEANGHAIEAHRQIRMDFHLERGGAEARRLAVTLDKVRAISMAHGMRQVLDTRLLTGARFELAYEPAGDKPRYDTELPVIELGGMGGAVPVSILLDFLFPPLGDGPQPTGKGWQRTWTHTDVRGMTTGDQALPVRVTFAGVEDRDGVELARLEIASQEKGQALEGTILLGLADGVVREVTLAGEGRGSMGHGDQSFPYRQTTHVHLVLGDAPSEETPASPGRPQR